MAIVITVKGRKRTSRVVMRTSHWLVDKLQAEATLLADIYEMRQRSTNEKRRLLVQARNLAS